MHKFLNPFFWWKKRKSIILRIYELPMDIQWWIIYPFIKKGYIQNHDYEKILSLRNMHEGKCALLLGNGPSVTIEDLDSLSSSDMVVFGCNRIHLAYENTKLRPNYIVSSDEQVIEDFGQEIIDNNKNSNVFFIDKKRPFFNGKYTWFKLKNGRPFRFSKNPTYQVMSGGGTLISTIQIAKYMGIKKFYLYGVDHNFNFQEKKSKNYRSASGDGNHFIKGYRSGKSWQAPVMDLVEESFAKSDQVMRKEKGFIINITKGGRLEVLERRDFDEIFATR